MHVISRHSYAQITNVFKHTEHVCSAKTTAFSDVQKCECYLCHATMEGNMYDQLRQ